MSTKDEIFDYVMNSPENTNPSILKSLLNDLEVPMQEQFIITLTPDDNMEVWTSDKSFSEIAEAYNQNKNIFVRATDFLISLSGVKLKISDDTVFEFQFITYGYNFKGDNDQFVGIYIDENEINVRCGNIY